jgi:surface polysaccharide O-acyltransferase-like enzyme
MELTKISYYLGIAIVILSHVYMLVYPDKPMDLKQHAWINLLAAALIAYYFLSKEGMI